MKFLQLKKVNNNISKPLNQLFREKLATDTDTRRYFYADCIWNSNTRNYISAGARNTVRQYTIPINGYYTIRAYSDYYGSYGKIIGKFTKGEVLSMNFISGYVSSTERTVGIDIRSNKKRTTVFQVLLSGQTATINGISPDYISALAIGGSLYYNDGGDAFVRCNNGIAVGAGGGSNLVSSYLQDGIRGYNGGNAHAWGSNVYAIGGGGGAGKSGYQGYGGNAYINNTAVTASYNEAKMANAIYSCKGNNSYVYGSNYRGGNGGCGGAGYITLGGAGTYGQCGYGYYGDGGIYTGGSAKGGNGRIETATFVLNTRGYGYFAGGSPSMNSSAGTNNGMNGGNGGFYGGNGIYGNGGYSQYGFGGTGYYGNGGDGQLKGGTGYYGGNGLVPGGGTIQDGTAIRHKSIVHTVPAFNKHGASIVIIEYGISQDNY